MTRNTALIALVFVVTIAIVALAAILTSSQPKNASPTTALTNQPNSETAGRTATTTTSTAESLLPLPEQTGVANTGSAANTPPSPAGPTPPVCGTWSIASVDALAGQKGELRGVAAVDSSDAWAVGWTAEKLKAGWGPLEAPVNAHAVILHWDGSHWSLSPASLPAVSTLNRVAAISTDDVWAVGGAVDDNSAGGYAFAIHWDGHSWAVASLPGNRPDLLRSVSGSASNDVWAVGPFAHSDNPVAKSWILHWDGKAWSNVPAPAPISVTPIPNAVNNPSFVSSYDLSAVVAVSKNEAWAVGTASDPVNMWYSHPAILKWDGSEWHYSSTTGGSVNVSSQVGSLVGIGAYAPGTSSGAGSREPSSGAWAVGEFGYQGPPGGSPPLSNSGLIAHETGGEDNWRWIDLPCLTGTLRPCSEVEDDSYAIDWLNGVAAISSNDAWLVGSKQYSPALGAPGSITTALVERWNGAEWQVILPGTLAEDLRSLTHSSLVAIASVPDPTGGRTDNLWAVGTLGEPNDTTPLILQFLPQSCTGDSAIIAP